MAKAWTARPQDYAIDKALASGALDSAGNPTIHVKGNTREEIVVQLMEGAAAWGMPMTKEQAEARADAAIKAIKHSWPAWMMPTVVGAVMLIAALILGWM